MTTASLVICCSLLGQIRSTDAPPASNPRFTPRVAAPPAQIDDDRPSNSTKRPPIYSDDEPADRTGRSRYSALDNEKKNRTFDSESSRDLRTSEADDRLTSVGNINQKLRPPEIIAEALSEVPEGAFLPAAEGDPSQYQTLRLVDAIKRASDRGQQIKIAQLYWRLAIEQADYHFARDAVNRLREATRGQLNQPALRAARCAMRALQRDAETLVVRAQNALAVEMNLAPTALMPLAVDVPHTGSYDTRFSQVYSGRTAPPRAYLIDRTLPLRRQAIEEHAEGILAGLDAVDASAEEYAKSTADLTTLILAFERLWKERKAFTNAVREYNQDIAEYALTVAPATNDPNALVAMLIKTSTGGARTTVPGTTSPRSSGPIDDDSPSTVPSKGTGRDRYDRSAQPEDEEETTPPLRPRTSPDPFRRTSNYPPATKRNIDFDEADAERARWRALVDVDTPLRTQRLADTLNDQEMLPRDAGQQVSLADCLSKCSPGARRDVITAFWRAREAAAVFQVVNDEATELADLSQAATRIRNTKGGPEAGIRLQSLRRIVKAALRDAQIEMLLTQFDLTSLCRARLEDEWLLPSTAPHGGRYLLRLEDQPREVVEARRLDQLGTVIKVLHEQMEDHAGTVVYADSARATALREPGSGPEAFDLAMALVERQATHTVFFLRATTKYNLAIADYVLAIMPENAPADKIVSALVLTRNRNVRS